MSKIKGRSVVIVRDSRMKKAFSLVEILIVVTILGILAAVIMPSIKDYAQQAKESASKDNLRLLRNAIELYASQHKGVAPGYPDNNPSLMPTNKTFYTQLTGGDKYLSEPPKNPFNTQNSVKMVLNGDDFPSEPSATNLYGWIYKPATKTIRLNWSGMDSQGAAYFDY